MGNQLFHGFWRSNMSSNTDVSVVKNKPIRRKRAAKLSLEGTSSENDDFPDISKRRKEAILRGELDEFGRPIKPFPTTRHVTHTVQSGAPELPIADPPAETDEIPTLLRVADKPIVPVDLQDDVETIDPAALAAAAKTLHQTPLLPIPEVENVQDETLNLQDQSDESETEMIQAVVDVETLADEDVEPCLHILCR